tara:strand:- start:119 stop:322 length:204 start_codon:yes stop_codon:yes gene_type:complete
MTLVTYIIIGFVFGFTCNMALEYMPSRFKKPPQILKEFGWVDNLIMIGLWPICLCIFLYSFFKEITK